MRDDLRSFQKGQVFLNYPFDEDFEPLAIAMHFAVVAAGLIPVCAHDLSAPDQPRLQTLIDAIINCRYSVHDFSRSKGEGQANFARFNMPIEMGMALFHALHTQRADHRCAFFTAKPHEHQIFASDLGGLDPKFHDNDEIILLCNVYEWLRDVGKPLANNLSTIDVKERYEIFKKELARINGNGRYGNPNHNEAQELMYIICSECKWWDWRAYPLGKGEFTLLPLRWKY